ncbi:hypothetical protein ACC680_37025, partial [Rhizobium ruizarguesonis]
WIDPFFYSSPSGFVQRLYEWATEGTTEGSLWYNLWVTMEEALIGFFAGSMRQAVLDQCHDVFGKQRDEHDEEDCREHAGRIERT